jgi:hypothetical protein
MTSRFAGLFQRAHDSSAAFWLPTERVRHGDEYWRVPFNTCLLMKPSLDNLRPCQPSRQFR